MKKSEHVNKKSILIHSAISLALFLASVSLAVSSYELGYRWNPRVLAMCCFAVPIVYLFCVLAYSGSVKESEKKGSVRFS